MNDIQIITALQGYKESEADSCFRKMIAQSALEIDNPVQHLLDMYKDKGLMYSIDEYFFLDNLTEIAQVYPTLKPWHREQMTLSALPIQLSFFCYQACLENLLIEFDLIKESERFFTNVET